MKPIRRDGLIIRIQRQRQPTGCLYDLQTLAFAILSTLLVMWLLRL